jgi:hypothetical protein
MHKRNARAHRSPSATTIHAPRTARLKRTCGQEAAMRTHPLALPFAAALSVASVGAAGETCTFLPQPRQVFVGNTAGDAACNFADIGSAVADAALHPTCSTTIHVMRSTSFEHLAIASQSLTLQGWGDGTSCSSVAAQCDFLAGCPTPDSTQPLATVDGSSSGRVLAISGTSYVSLRNIRITHGDAGGGDGGGIAFAGAGRLSLTRSDVSTNHAGYGGGINFNGSGGAAELYLLGDTTLFLNTAAVSGGGIRVEGSARLYALQPSTYIHFNHAENGYGGGIEIIGPARADIGSSGYNGDGVVSYNDAADGGGIAAVPVSNGSATVRMFTTDAANPVQVDNNLARSHGGGVYLGAESSNFNRGVLCAYDFRIDDNQGSDGAAIYVDSSSSTFDDDVGGEIYLNTVPPAGVGGAAQCGPETPPALGAVDCAIGAPCNELSGNRAADGDNAPTAGAVIAVGSGGSIQADPYAMRENSAATLLRLTGSDEAYVPAVQRNCLIADNHTQHEVVSVQDGRGFGINGCTMVGNIIDNGYVLYVNGRITLANSIIDQPGRSVLDFVGEAGNRGIDYVIANETASLPGAQHTQGNTLVYVDAAGGDYHLAPNSPGVDYAPAQGGTDLDGNPRDLDLASKANLYGPRDIGAYERLTAFLCGTADTIFCSGFEP